MKTDSEYIREHSKWISDLITAKEKQAEENINS